MPPPGGLNKKIENKMIWTTAKALWRYLPPFKNQKPLKGIILWLIYDQRMDQTMDSSRREQSVKAEEVNWLFLR